ncbi:hypothetical protein [Streptomyces sp. NPDC001404]|uniref:hypothetical protein n=1 Tax=Streptomyces sp. NPDC001404 TaxID=3364571 RepID=UPI0036AF3A96
MGPPPRPHHVYEGAREEVARAVEAADLVVDDSMGLPPESDEVATELAERYGTGAVDWYRDLATWVPKALLDTMPSAPALDRSFGRESGQSSSKGSAGSSSPRSPSS